MISDQDISKLKKTFTTKEDLADLKLEVGELYDKVDGLDEKFDAMRVTLDGIAGKLDDSLLEHAAGAVHLARHDRQIDALAKGTKIQIPN